MVESTSQDNKALHQAMAELVNGLEGWQSRYQSYVAQSHEDGRPIHEDVKAQRARDTAAILLNHGVKNFSPQKFMTAIASEQVDFATPLLTMYLTLPYIADVCAQSLFYSVCDVINLYDAEHVLDGKHEDRVQCLDILTETNNDQKLSEQEKIKKLKEVVQRFASSCQSGRGMLELGRSLEVIIRQEGITPQELLIFFQNSFQNYRKKHKDLKAEVSRKVMVVLQTIVNNVSILSQDKIKRMLEVINEFALICLQEQEMPELYAVFQPFASQVLLSNVGKCLCKSD